MSYAIIASFPTNRDIKGVLKLYDNNNRLIFGPVDALGRGSNSPLNKQNHADWMLPDADIPTGEYQVSIVDPGNSLSSFGPHKRVWLEKALSGNALLAEKNGRKEIMIHGGDPITDHSLPWFPLHPTLGCIRLSNTDQAALISAIETVGGNGKINISNH